MKLAAISPPRLRTVQEEERTATWLELFYDLAFVAAVAAVGVHLLGDSSATGWLSYAGYFTLIWWLWASHTFYADRFDTDDLVYRVIAGSQMVAIAFLAASLLSHSGEPMQVFAAAYAFFRIMLVVLYARVHRHVAAARRLVTGYMWGFGAAAVVWTASIFVPDPARFWLWGIALAIDLATPFAVRKAQAAVPLDVSHLPERFGLFTILVLGETIVATTVGLGHVDWQWATSIAGAFGILTAIGVWWVHFDNVDGFVVRRRGQKTDWRPTVWIYSHLPLAVGIGTLGVGVEHVIVAADAGHEYHTDERWILAFGAALAFAAMATIAWASKPRSQDPKVKARVVANRLLGSVAALAVGFVGLGPTLTIALLAGVCALQVGADVAATRVGVEHEADVDADEPANAEE